MWEGRKYAIPGSMGKQIGAGIASKVMRGNQQGRGLDIYG